MLEFDLNKEYPYMTNPKVSIIVPIYKVPEPFLRRCIESCVNQTLTDIEIILVDDGSPDDCGRICDEYAKKDIRIKVVHKENGGLVSARNAGYEVVTGEWMMYIDGDDWIDLNTCEEAIKHIEFYHDVDIVFWKCIQELRNQSIKGKWEWPCTDDEHIYVGEECKELSRNVLVYKSGIATAYCKLIRTEYAHKYGIKHDTRLKQGAEGLEFSLRAFYYAEKALYVNAYWYHYIYNPDSISRSINESNSLYLTNCLKVIEENISSFKNKDLFTKTLYQRTIYILIAMAMSTYFHPDNNESLYIRSKKYAKVINDYNLYKQALKYASTNGMDRQRRITLMLIRMKMYFMLDIIGKLKQVMFKRGKFNY